MVNELDKSYAIANKVVQGEGGYIREPYHEIEKHHTFKCHKICLFPGVSMFCILFLVKSLDICHFHALRYTPSTF